MGRRGAGKNKMTSNLTPEEDAIGDPVEDNDEIDDTLPADLWFRARKVDCGIARALRARVARIPLVRV
jgi:hypothetical protein